MSSLLQFGSFVFPAGFKPMSFEASYDAAPQERPRGHGAATQLLRKKPLQLSVAGSVMGANAAAIQSVVDGIRAACESLVPQKLYFGRSDRYIWAQCVNAPESYGSASGDGTAASWYGAAHGLLLTFAAGWPFFIDNAGTQTATLTDTGGTVTTSGSAPTYATWNITVGTGGTGLITLTNEATGEAAVLSGTFTAGDVISLQRGVQVPGPSGGVGIVYQCVYNSVATPGLMLGIIPTLCVGSNVVAISATGGVAVSAAGCAYVDQWNS